MYPDRSVLHELKIVEMNIKRQVEADARKHEYEGITGMQMMILDYITRHGDERICQKDIARHFSVRNASVTGILQNMEKNGLIVRESVDADARLKKITATEKGIHISEDARTDMQRTEKRLRDALTEKELECFFSAADKLIKELQNGGNNDQETE